MPFDTDNLGRGRRSTRFFVPAGTDELACGVNYGWRVESHGIDLSMRTFSDDVDWVTANIERTRQVRPQHEGGPSERDRHRLTQETETQMVRPASGFGADHPSDRGTRDGASVFRQWLPFFLVLVVLIAGLMWLGPVVPLPSFITAPSYILCAFFMPLAAFLVPACWRIPENERKLTWLAVPTILAGAALAFVSGGVGADLAWQDRGQTTQAKVVAVDEGKTDRCTLRKPDGEEISGALEEGDGCDGGVEPGDVLNVRYDPAGGLDPTADPESPGETQWVLMVGLAAAFVALGSLGAVRMDRRRREHARA